MWKLHVAIFPASSVAVTFTTLAPMGNSCPDWLLDRTWITAFGSTCTELSVTWTLHLTFAVGFPLSVLVSMVGPGQLSTGGWISTRRHTRQKCYPKHQKWNTPEWVIIFSDPSLNISYRKPIEAFENELKSSTTKLVNFLVDAWGLENSGEV